MTLGGYGALDASEHEDVRARVLARDPIHLAADVDALRARLHPHHLAVETPAIDL